MIIFNNIFNFIIKHKNNKIFIIICSIIFSILPIIFKRNLFILFYIHLTFTYSLYKFYIYIKNKKIFTRKVQKDIEPWEFDTKIKHTNKIIVFYFFSITLFVVSSIFLFNIPDNIIKINNIRKIIQKSDVFYINDKPVTNNDEFKKFLLNNISVTKTIASINVGKLKDDSEPYKTSIVIKNQYDDKIEMGASSSCYYLDIRLDYERNTSFMILENVYKQREAEEFCKLISK